MSLRFVLVIMPIPWSFSSAQNTNDEPPSQEVLEHFKIFYETSSFPQAIEAFEFVLRSLNLEFETFHKFFPILKSRLKPHLPYKFQKIWDILEKKSKLPVYGCGIASEYNVLVVGAGPCGLRSAIETQFLGAQTIVVEKRQDFTRNNVLKLWKFLVEDLKSIGIKKLYGGFATGEVNHIGIKTLQLVLSKICLLIGVRIVCPITFRELSMPLQSGKRWTGSFLPEGHSINQYSFDMIIVASGKNVPNSMYDDFRRFSLGAKLSIAVTANFVNNQTKEEKYVEQIPGLSKQYHQQFFANIEKDKGISLENIVYYKGETHYFVMTTTRKSLLNRGVLIEDNSDRNELLSPNNINKKDLYQFAIDAAEYSTDNLSHMLPTQEFALDHCGEPDVSVFDFTDLYSASNAGVVKKLEEHKLIMGIVGDSLLQPFWPEGTGCARGFLSAFNAAWMLHRYASGTKIIKILAERQNLFQLLKQTTDGPGSVLKQDYQNYTIDPKTRYNHIPRKLDQNKIPQLYQKISKHIPETPLDDDAEDVIDIPIPSRLRPITNSIHYLRKTGRATYRKRVVTRNKRQESLTFSRRNTEIDQETNKNDEEYQSNTHIFSSHGLEKVENSEPEESKIAHQTHFTERIAFLDAKSALNILKEYANQNGINGHSLIEFEEILDNAHV